MPLIIEAPKPLTRITAAIHRQLNIVFFGTPLFAVPSLRRLREDGWPIVAVVTAPEKPVGRRKTLMKSPVHVTAEELDIPAFTPATLKDDAFYATFDALRPDLCIVVAYGKLIPHRYLTLPRLGFINVHPSLLPLYRGPSPIQSAILDGVTSTGVSIMLLDDEMDHGPLLATTPWTIPGGFDASLCEDELARIGATLLAETLPGYVQGSVQPHQQDHERATYCKKFTRQDGLLDWHKPAHAVVNRIRALGSNPGTWTTWHGKALNIFHARVADQHAAGQPGLVHRSGAECIVTTAEGSVIVEELQLEGGRRQVASDFFNGHGSFAGAILGA